MTEKARAFAALHRKGDPLVLYNIWDAGSAKAVAESGARALATGSWSVAAAQGYADGEAIPLDQLVSTVRQIVAATDLPVSVDFEGAYSADPKAGAQNVARLIEAGAVGINFEDQVIGGTGLHDVEAQVLRIRAIREMAAEKGVDLFINARTDLFLKEPDAAKHAGLADEAIVRGLAYARAGASGFFVPALIDPALVARVTQAVDLPVNVLMKPGAPDAATFAKAGVARISHGPFAYRAMINWLRDQAGSVYTPA